MTPPGQRNAQTGLLSNETNRKLISVFLLKMPMLQNMPWFSKFQGGYGSTGRSVASEI